MRVLLIAAALWTAGCAMKYRDNIMCDRPVPFKAAHVTVIPDGDGLMIHYRNHQKQRVSGAACVLELDVYPKNDKTEGTVQVAKPAEKK